VGGPGLDFETWVSREKSEHPGLKSETWATHLIFVRVIFIFLGGPQAHVSPSGSRARSEPNAGVVGVIFGEWLLPPVSFSIHDHRHMVVCVKWMLKQRGLLATTGVGFMMCSFIGGLGQSAAAPTPILVELFTSEGCSSCPPADALLQKMDAFQPVPGAQLIVLSEHVDYWDQEGWKDQYSSRELTNRQKSYVSELGLPTAYTPQIIVDGTAELHANDSQQVKSAFEKALKDAKIPIRIDSVNFEGPQEAAVVRGHLQVDAGSENHNADIYIAVALNHAETQVLRGENQGQTLTHVAVVQEMVKVGKLQKKGSFSQDFQVKLKPGTKPGNVRIVAFVQEPGSGKVVAAASVLEHQGGTGIASR
jgi:hypothetical protein